MSVHIGMKYLTMFLFVILFFQSLLMIPVEGRYGQGAKSGGAGHGQGAKSGHSGRNPGQRDRRESRIGL